MRRRISAKFAGNIGYLAPALLFLAVMAWLTWALTPLWMFAIYVVIVTIVFYIEFHVRKIEFDENNLYVGRFVQREFVTVPLNSMKSIKLLPVGYWVILSFREKTPVGSWIILIPQPRILIPLKTHPDVLDLMNRVKDAQRMEVPPDKSAAENSMHNSGAKSS